MKARSPQKYIKKGQLLILAGLVGILLIAGSYIYYRYEERAIRNEKYNELKSIAELKINQIVRWREEIISDAIVFSQRNFIKTSAIQYLDTKGKPTLKGDIFDQLSFLKLQYGYEDVLISSPDGKLFLAPDSNIKTLDPNTRDKIKKAVDQKKVIFTDFYYCKVHKQIHLDVIAPIADERKIPIAALILRIDPDEFLYPLIQSWPLPSKSAETLIVRKDRDSVVFVNELRHISNTALKFRISLKNNKVPAVQAVLGYVGIWEGIDYRGVEVLSDIRPVPGTSWFMIAKIDKKEIFSELYYRAVIVIVLTIVLLLFLGIGLAWFYSNRQKNIYRELLETNTALLESEDKFKYVFDHSAIGKSITLPSGEIHVNSAFCEMLGYSHKELEKSKWQELSYPEDIELTQKALDSVISGEKDSVQIMKRYMHKNGSIVWGDVRTTLRRDQKGKALYFMTSVLDITERILAEEALRMSEAKLLAVLDATPFPVALVDVWDNNIDYWSRSALTLFGHTAPTAPEWYLIAYPDPIYRQEVIDRWKPFLERAQQTAQPVNTGEYRVTCSDGSVRICELYATFLSDKLIVTFNDITERKLAENSLRESERKLREAQEMAHLGFWSWDVKTGEVEWSDEVFKIFCLDPKEFTPQIDSILALSPWPEDNKRDQELINRAVETHTPGSYEQKFLRPDKSIGYYYSTYQGNYDEKGSLISIVGTVLDITERKLAEEVSKKEQALSNAIIESIPGTFYMLDEIGQYVRWNAYQRDEIVGKPDDLVGSTNALDTIHPDDRGLIQSKIANVLANGVDETVEGRVLLRGGPAARWLVMTGCRMLIDGHPFLIGTGIDITERKLAEEELKKSESFLNNIINQSPYPMWISDEKGILIRINQSCLDLLHITEEEVHGKYNILKDNIVEKQGFMSLVKSVFETGETVKFELKYDSSQLKHLQLANFNYLILNVTIFPIKDAKGIISNAVIQHIDITEQKRADQEILKLNTTLEQRVKERTAELKESEERFRQLAEASYEAIIIHEGGVLLRANDQYFNLFGYKPEELLGNQVMPITTEPQSLEMLNKQIATSGTGPYLATGKRKNGTTFPMEIRARNMEYKGRNVRIASILDITWRKQTEEALRERTASLEIANKELEAFSYSVSHDLRAPLRHISGYVELLTNQFHNSFSEKGKHYLDSIAGSAHQMGILIDDLLQFSRNNRQEMRQTRLDMNIVLQEVLETIKSDIIGRSIKWDIGKLPHVYGDHALLRLVWSNLINNAVKFTRAKKKARIEIRYREEKREYVFFVRDNGAGFDMQYAQKLFGVFQRLHSPEEFEGTGIGLANVQRIVLRHGGRIWAEAELDKGAAFYFTLPRRQ
jgi:PAS domain S-box-containing protein